MKALVVDYQWNVSSINFGDDLPNSVCTSCQKSRDGSCKIFAGMKFRGDGRHVIICPNRLPIGGNSVPCV